MYQTQGLSKSFLPDKLAKRFSEVNMPSTAKKHIVQKYYMYVIQVPSCKYPSLPCYDCL